MPNEGRARYRLPGIRKAQVALELLLLGPRATLNPPNMSTLQNAFSLRYQQAVRSASDNQPIRGPTASHERASRDAALLGTQTSTAVFTESPDNDPTDSGCLALPRWSEKV